MTPEEYPLRQINLGGGLRIKVPFVNQEIFDKMNVCDDCSQQGSLNYNLDWIWERVLCAGCIRIYAMHIKDSKK